jgi:hypothetical protein
LIAKFNLQKKITVIKNWKEKEEKVRGVGLCGELLNQEGIMVRAALQKNVKLLLKEICE